MKVVNDEESKHILAPQQSFSHGDQIGRCDGLQQVKDQYQTFINKLKAEQERLNRDISDLNQAPAL